MATYYSTAMMRTALHTAIAAPAPPSPAQVAGILAIAADAPHVVPAVVLPPHLEAKAAVPAPAGVLTGKKPSVPLHAAIAGAVGTGVGFAVAGPLGAAVGAGAGGVVGAIVAKVREAL